MFVYLFKIFSTFGIIRISISGKGFITITTFLWKGKEQCCFVYDVSGRSDNSYSNNIFHDYTKAVFPTENVLFLQKEDIEKKMFSYCWKNWSTPSIYKSIWKSLNLIRKLAWFSRNQNPSRQTAWHLFLMYKNNSFELKTPTVRQVSISILKKERKDLVKRAACFDWIVSMFF